MNAGGAGHDTPDTALGVEVEVPAPVRDGVAALLARLGLRFGTFDFIVAPDDSWWFLEVNPNGQWAWIEDATGLPITAAITDALRRGGHVSIEQLRTKMVEQMIAAGSLRSGAWIAAFTAVPRHLFLRRFFRQSGDLSGWEAVSDTDPGALELIYDGATWVTQLDNDPHRWQDARAQGRATPGTPTSSSTAPGLMALMLEALDVHDGHRVLEVGTGSGYNAALLCHRLGSTLVVTVEVDPAVADTAHASLHAAGYTPSVAVADGAAGHPEGSPYDRLIATCSTTAIPPAWINQVRPGGLILTSLHRDLGGGPLVLLRVVGDRHAEGRFLPDYGGFMPLRVHPPADAGRLLDAALSGTASDTRPTALGADLLDSADFGMVAALRLPGLASIGFTPEGSGPQWWLLAADGSWACLDVTTLAVSQHGGRRLWDELEDVHQQWTQLGEPARDRLGLTVTPNGEHRFWLDTPDGAWWWSNPTEPAAA